jgi:hypothetical protein
MQQLYAESLLVGPSLPTSLQIHSCVSVAIAAM